MSQFHWWEARIECISYIQLRKTFLSHFQDAMSENIYEVLMILEKTHLVVEFIEKFELMSSLLHHVDEKMLRGVFMSRLKNAVRVEVCLHGSGDLEITMKMSKQVEEKNRVLDVEDV